MNKNKLLPGGGENLSGGGKWGWRGREVGERGGKRRERGREVGIWYPPVHPLIFSTNTPCRWKIQMEHKGSIDLLLLMYVAVCRILCCFIQ